MNDFSDKFDIHFYQLIISLHGAAMQQMGKIVSPLTGKIERDLLQAKGSIDLLEMLQKKSEGNRTDDETKLLQHVLYELRMNFVEESKKGESKSPDSKETNTDPSESSATVSTESDSEK